MKLEECKKCKHHYRMKFDDILCQFNGGYDYRVIAKDKKDENIVVMCPREAIAVSKSAIVMQSFKSILNIS